MERMARGEASALTEFARELGPLVLGSAEGVLGDRGAAEAVVLEVLAEVWAHAPLWDHHRGPPWAHALAITRGLLMDRLGGRRFRGAAKAEIGPRDSDDPAGSWRAPPTPGSARALLPTLPEDERRVLTRLWSSRAAEPLDGPDLAAFRRGLRTLAGRAPAP